jgi:hypothetical protein
MGAVRTKTLAGSVLYEDWLDPGLHVRTLWTIALSSAFKMSMSWKPLFRAGSFLGPFLLMLRRRYRAAIDQSPLLFF